MNYCSHDVGYVCLTWNVTQRHKRFCQTRLTQCIFCLIKIDLTNLTPSRPKKTQRVIVQNRTRWYFVFVKNSWGVYWSDNFCCCYRIYKFFEKRYCLTANQAYPLSQVSQMKAISWHLRIFCQKSGSWANEAGEFGCGCVGVLYFYFIMISYANV